MGNTNKRMARRGELLLAEMEELTRLKRDLFLYVASHDQEMARQLQMQVDACSARLAKLNH